MDIWLVMKGWDECLITWFDGPNQMNDPRLSQITAEVDLDGRC